MSKRKSFAFHAESWLGSPKVRKMTSAARGAYIQLLAESWIADPQGYLPSNDRDLRRLAGMTGKEWEENKDAILENFQREGRRYYNPKLMAMVKKQRPNAPGNLPVPTPKELADLELYREDERLCRRWHELLAAWKVAYPGIDILAEVRKAHAWEVVQPIRKKDRAAFLRRWLNRTFDKRDRRRMPARNSLTPFGPTEDDLDAWARDAVKGKE